MAATQTSELRRAVLAQSRPSLRRQVEAIDQRVSIFLARHSVTLLRVSVGVVFFWFGALKLQTGLSPAEHLIRESITFLPMQYFLPFLAVLEMVIGLGFITGKAKRLVLLMLLGQMAGAMSPMVLRPDLIWNVFPYAWTLEGQYVFKDIILVSAGLVSLGATARGGGMVSEKEDLEAAREHESELE